MRFTKLQGCGNDYLYVDCVTQSPPADPAELARRMSDRHFGVGSDGLILILTSAVADVRMRMFNADGSEGEMCGNGIRGLGKYVYDHGISRKNPLQVETLRGVLSIELHPGAAGTVESATVDMDEPILDAARIPVILPRKSEDGRVVNLPLMQSFSLGTAKSWMEDCGLDSRFTCVSMGSPHAVIFCDDVNLVPLESIGPILERQPIFPNRMNIHVATTLSTGEVRMRSWERGSGVTLACGTGACSVVVAGVLTSRLEREVLVHLSGGDLKIEWRESNNHVYKTGPSVEVFSGEWPYA